MESPYPSCHYIQYGLNFYPNNKIKICCFTKDEAMDAALTTDSIEDIIEKVFRKKQEIINKFSVGEIYSCCAKCPCLIEKAWGEIPLKIHSVTLNHFMFCNLKCGHCGYLEGVKSGHLVDTDHHRVLEIIRELEARYILSDDVSYDVGGGEPSVSEGLQEIVSYILSRSKRIHINSNGARYVDLFATGVNQGLLSLTLTPDAGSRETYIAVKGQDNFQKTWKNIAKYISHCNSNVLIKFILQDTNLSDIRNMIDRSFEVGAKHLSVSLDLRISETDKPNYLSHLREFRELASQKGINVRPGLVPPTLWQYSNPAPPTNPTMNLDRQKINALISEQSPIAHCIACGSAVESWQALDGNAFGRSAFGEAIDSIGSDLSRFWCPHCRSTDRDRHLILYLDAVGVTAGLAGADVLHLAPEAAISNLIRQRGPRRYIRGDLQPAADDIERIDLESLPFADASFDYVICNHVLEHVNSVVRALAEVARVLRPCGRFVCQTPYARRLTTTFEDPELQSEADRVFFYGQNDHVRRFGRDIGAIIRDSGFRGALRAHDEVLGEIDAAAFGVNEREPFFDFVRDVTCSAPQAVRAADSSVTAAPRLANQIRALIDGTTAPACLPTGDQAAADDYDHAQHAAARAAIAAGDVTGAIAALIDLATRGTPLAEVYGDLGDLAVDGGDPAAAIDLYRAAADRAAAPERALVKLGSCLLADGQRDAALAAAGEALRHDPTDAEALHLARMIVAPNLSTLAWLRLVADLRHQQVKLSARVTEQDRTLAAIGEIASAALFKDNL